MFDVITVGGAVVDTFLDTNIHEHFIKKNIEVCYPLGAKIKINNVDIFTGGGGTNTAVAFSRLGLKTGFIGKIGADKHGEMIYNELRKERVKFLGIISKEHNTDFSIILDSKGKDRTILNYKDASKYLHYDELKRYYNTRWFYLTSMVDDSFKTINELAVKYTGRANFGFNASSYVAEKGVSYLREILRACTVFVLNKEEAQALVKKKDIMSMLLAIRKTGPSIVCITDGSNGSYTYDGSYVYYQKPHKIKVVEKTGAGDAYAATFIAGLIKGKSIENALSMALANAESVITHKGAKNILLSWSETVNGKSAIIKKEVK